jgi:tRNA G37 N-methylase Trm5
VALSARQWWITVRRTGWAIIGDIIIISTSKVQYDTQRTIQSIVLDLIGHVCFCILVSYSMKSAFQNDIFFLCYSMDDKVVSKQKNL